MIAQIYGWIGNCLFFAGAVFLAKRNICGWYCQLIANILYIAQSYILNNSSLFWLSIILSIVNIFGAYKWKKEI